ANIMRHVSVVSAVSGGTLAGARYFTDLDRQLRENPGQHRLDACDAVIDRFAATLLNLPLRPRGDARRYVERHWFAPALTLADLPANGPRLLLGATAVNSGQRVVHGREHVRAMHEQIEQPETHSLSLAAAVAAGLSTPGTWRPVPVGSDLLADGAMADNQGVETLLDYFSLSIPTRNNLIPTLRQADDADSPIVMIVCDGSRQAAEFAKPSASDAYAIMHAESRRRMLTWLLEGSETGPFETLVLAHRGMALPEDRVDGAIPEGLIAALAGLPDDLGRVGRLERDLLVYQGYLLMATQIEALCPELLPYNLSLLGFEGSNFRCPPVSLELCDPSVRAPKSALANRELLAKHLRDVGHSRSDLRRFPVLYGGLAVLAIAGGWALLHLLLHGAGLGASLQGELAAVGEKIVGVFWERSASRIVQGPLDPGGSVWGLIHVLAAAICVGLAAGTAWLGYASIKQVLRLPERCDNSLLAGLQRKMPRVNEQALEPATD
ncbi:MAG: putative acylesterase/phospholipase RssA, partial [Rhodothermales bacterium]